MRDFLLDACLKVHLFYQNNKVLKENKELLQPSTKRERRKHEVLEEMAEDNMPSTQSEVKMMQENRKE